MHKHLNLLVFTCKAMGIKQVVLSPGSRSAPLVYAFGSDGNFTIHTVVDERSAAYQALGMAHYLQQPVILICTSGTAAANYLPAITEAHYRKIPLLVLTADRPPQLLNQQDGQMINQQHLYGSHARAFLALKTHYQEKEHRSLAKQLQSVIGQIMIAPYGVAHINVPLAEPLYGELVHTKSSHTLANGIRPLKDKQTVQGNNGKSIQEAWLKAKRKLILVGEGTMDAQLITPLITLRDKQDVVVLADVASNKHAYGTTPYFDQLIGSLEEQKLNHLAPDFIVSMGGAMLSKNLKNWLKKQQPAWHFRIKNEPEAIDTYGNLTGVVEAKAVDVLTQLSTLAAHSTSTYKQNWLTYANQLSLKIQGFIGQSGWNELSVTAKVLRQLPNAAQLHLANSSVVRYASLLGEIPADVLVNANRGVSGIDGCTSTAVGAALVNQRPTVLLTGDLAFLYDKNALWQHALPDNLRIIVLNNGGGGIFSLIEGPTSIKKYAPYFTTPHQQNIKGIALVSGLEYYFCDNNTALDGVLEQFFNPLGKAALLELRFDMDKNAQVFKKYKKISI